MNVRCVINGLWDLTIYYNIILIHAGEKEFDCPLCDKRFQSKFAQNQHMHCHSVDKPFKCTVCDKKFITNTYLQRHMLKIECFHVRFVQKRFKKRIICKDICWYILVKNWSLNLSFLKMIKILVPCVCSLLKSLQYKVNINDKLCVIYQTIVDNNPGLDSP